MPDPNKRDPFTTAETYIIRITGIILLLLAAIALIIQAIKHIPI